MSWLYEGYWPFWFGAIAFMVLVVGIWLIERRMLGVSGVYTAALAKETEAERALRRAEFENPNSIEDAMLKATLEEFGQEAVDEFLKEMREEEGEAELRSTTASRPLPRLANLVFLCMMVVGGVLGSMLSGSWELRCTMGTLHTALMHGETAGFITLFIGGIFVGFGTRMSGGCTSGHGLSGCSTMQPTSIVATCAFFGTGVAVSFLLKALA